MFTFIPDRAAKTPAYEQLYKFIRAAIESAEIASGERMPSKRKLAAHLKLSKTTIESAYAQLAAEGYIKSVPKSGYFVSKLEPLAFSGRQKSSFTYTPGPEDGHESGFLYDFRTDAVSLDLFPFATWASIARGVLSAENSGLLKHTHPQGLPALREEISKYLKSYRGISADPGQIIIGAGSEYLFGMAVTLLGRHGVYAVENPGYNKISAILKNNGAKIVHIHLDSYGLDPAQLRACGARVVHITPSHQFPSGTVMPVARRAELLSWANEQSGRYIIEDDYDSEFRFSGNPIQALQGLDAGERVIYINSFSKSLAPSMRISYMILPPHLMDVYREKFVHNSCTVPSFEQHILCEFMKKGYFERHLGRMRKAYKEKRDALIRALTTGALAGKIEIIGQDAGLHFLISVENGMGEAELVRRAKSAGVRVYGLSEYCAGPVPDMGKSTVVVGYSGIGIEEIAKSARLLEKAWG
jgi:GntR family transcriptional regulator/MocR family aminotransferase